LGQRRPDAQDIPAEPFAARCASAAALIVINAERPASTTIVAAQIDEA